MKASIRTAAMMIVIMMLSPLSITTSHTVMAYDDPTDTVGSLSTSGTAPTSKRIGSVNDASSLAEPVEQPTSAVTGAQDHTAG